MKRKIILLNLLLFFITFLFSCNQQDKIEEFVFDDFKVEYVLGEEVDVSQIKVKTIENGEETFTPLTKENVSGLDNVTSTLGLKQLSLEYNDIKDLINIFVYYNDDDSTYKENYRSQFHYSKDKGHINDPNGLIYNAKTKEYHLYYQDGNRMGADPNNYWSSRSWGHAVSRDLVHWEQQEGLAIFPEPDGFGDIWSGCCVIDYENSCGLFPDYIEPEERIVAIYSVTRPQQQYCLAISLDGGYTFEKYEGNPVINNSKLQFGAGFRDCKAFWYEEENCFLMVTAGESGMRFFTSTNLLEWKFNSMVTDNDGNIIGYECPMIFPIAVSGEEDTVKYVISDGGTYYYIGSIKKNSQGNLTFKIESEKLSFNGGSHNYATMNWTLDSSRVIFTSWITDEYLGEFASSFPDKSWEGYISLPYEVTLKKNNMGNLQLYTMPISELDILKEKELFNYRDFDVSYFKQNIIKNIKDKTYEINIDLTFEPFGGTPIIGFNLRKGDNDEFVSIHYNTNEQSLVVDQFSSMVTKYKDEVYVNSNKDNRLKLRILVDVSCLDVIINDGENSISTIYFLNEENQDMEFFFKNCNVHINEMSIFHIKSIYHKSDNSIN